MASKFVSGVLVGMKPRKMTGDLVIEIEVAKEMAHLAYEKLGGFPRPEESRHIAMTIFDTEKDFLND
jgi:hypothetical protein